MPQTERQTYEHAVKSVFPLRIRVKCPQCNCNNEYTIQQPKDEAFRCKNCNRGIALATKTESSGVIKVSKLILSWQESYYGG